MTAPADCLDWAVAGRPMPGERVSGDQALHVPLGDKDLVVVVDGLGHGPEAADAAEQACRLVANHADETIEGLLALAHSALYRTRGVAMALASIGCTGLMRWVGVGNIEAHLFRPGGQRLRPVASAVLYGGVVGYRLPRVRVASVELRAGDLVVMATDGIEPGFVDGLVMPGTVDQLVSSILERCARSTDDALVAAACWSGPRLS